MEQYEYVIGLDFGTDSVRAVVVNVATGKEEANEVAYYSRWAEGKYCAPEQKRFRQHPLDYIESLEVAVKGALAQLPPGAGQQVRGIGIDTTGSTPCAVDKNGLPLALHEEFGDNSNAMFILWKDHTAVKEAEEINQLAKTWVVEYTKYEGGIYSTEWFWAKILRVFREDDAIQRAAYSWVEHCDWIPALLTGTVKPANLKRSRCAAGHKAMWHPDWDGLPPEDFLVALDPLLGGLRERLFTQTYTADQPVGKLTLEWAVRLGLNPEATVAVGAFDAHMGAVGGEIAEETLVKIMGTSTCDVMVAAPEVIGAQLIPGICGQVDGSVLPGLIGLEAGQSAFGDVYAWFKGLLSWPLAAILPTVDLLEPAVAARIKTKVEDEILVKLTEEAAKIAPQETGLIALDWLNGRRTPDADQTLKGAIFGLTLGTTAPKTFRALVEATAFGAKAIVERFRREGVAISQVVAMGGIAQKNDFVMQITADVLEMPIKVVRSEQACALGAAMFAAVAAGVYATVTEAQRKMGSGFSKTFTPREDMTQIYRELYRKYIAIGSNLETFLSALE